MLNGSLKRAYALGGWVQCTKNVENEGVRVRECPDLLAARNKKRDDRQGRAVGKSLAPLEDFKMYNSICQRNSGANPIETRPGSSNLVFFPRRFTDPVTPGACQRVASLLVPGPFRPQVTIHGPSTVQSHHFWRYQGFHLMDWHAQILTHTAVEVVAHEIGETPPKSSPPIAWKLDLRFTVPLVKMMFLMADVQRVMYDALHCALADFVPTQRSKRQPSGFGRTRVWRRSGTSEIWKGANVGSNPAMSIDRLVRSEFEWDGPNKRVGLIRPYGADLDLEPINKLSTYNLRGSYLIAPPPT
ncbi:hypothetical protein B0H11DRAFT_1923857 [Mycena galericulata]|nr:hypothetical protein B0H11DRAFT_1923857 [Mycena galericulata]